MRLQHQPTEGVCRPAVDTTTRLGHAGGRLSGAVTRDFCRIHSVIGISRCYLPTCTLSLLSSGDFWAFMTARLVDESKICCQTRPVVHSLKLHLSREQFTTAEKDDQNQTMPSHVSTSLTNCCCSRCCSYLKVQTRQRKKSHWKPLGLRGAEAAARLQQLQLRTVPVLCTFPRKPRRTGTARRWRWPS